MSEPTDPLCADLGWLLTRASHTLHTHLMAAMEEIGLTPRGRCVLAAAQGGEFTQIELAKAIGLDKTTMVVTVDTLERAGLAERKPSTKDRRAHVIAVTKAGERKLREAEKVARRVQEDVLDSLPAKERDALVGALRSLVSGSLAEPAPCAKPVRRRAAA